MTELITRISLADCGQLTTRQSCEGCPVYADASAIVAEGGDEAVRVLQTSKLLTQCPRDAEIDLQGLGIKLHPITEATQKLASVNAARSPKVRVW